MISLIKNKKKKKEIDNKLLASLMKELKECKEITSINSTFNKLYDLSYKTLWLSLKFKFIPPLSEEDLQDVFQESWVKIIESRDSYNIEYNAFNWIYTIMKNQTIDRIRKNNRNLEESYNDDFGKNDKSESYINISSNANLIDEDLIENEINLLIKEAIFAVNDEKERQILILRLIKGYKLEYIAEDLEMPLASVHYKLNKAIEKIRPKIESILEN